MLYILLKGLTYSRSPKQKPLEGELKVVFQITVHQDLADQYKNDPSTVSSCYFLHQLINCKQSHSNDIIHVCSTDVLLKLLVFRVIEKDLVNCIFKLPAEIMSV